VENSDRKCRQTLTHTHSMRENYEKKSSLLQISWVSMKMKMEDESNITAAEREKENFSTRHINIKWKAEKKDQSAFEIRLKLLFFLYETSFILHNTEQQHSLLSLTFTQTLFLYIYWNCIYISITTFLLIFLVELNCWGKKRKKIKKKDKDNKEEMRRKLSTFFRVHQTWCSLVTTTNIVWCVCKWFLII
jgi:hypothetical protein